MLASFCACNKNSGTKKQAAQKQEVAVQTALAQRQNMVVSLQGLGQATGFYTVAVRPQVDGLLTQVLFREGQTVAAGDVLGTIDARPFAIAHKNAEAALARDQAILKNAERNLKRYTQLHEQNLVAEQTLADQASLVQQSRAGVHIDEALLAQARLQLDYTQIKAPISGVTGMRQIDPGNIVRAADSNAILTIAQTDPISVLFSLPEDNFASVHTSLQAGPVGAEIYARDGVQLLARGTVALIDNRIDAGSGTIRLKAVVANKDGLLWPNQFVKVRLLLQCVVQALVVPAQAIQSGAQGDYVWVAEKDNTAQKRSVRLKAYQDDLALLEDGVLVGEAVVTDGQQLLRPGSKLLRASEAAPAAKDTDQGAP